MKNAADIRTVNEAMELADHYRAENALLRADFAYLFGVWPWLQARLNEYHTTSENFMSIENAIRCDWCQRELTNIIGSIAWFTLHRGGGTNDRQICYVCMNKMEELFYQDRRNAQQRAAL